MCREVFLWGGVRGWGVRICLVLGVVLLYFISRVDNLG